MTSIRTMIALLALVLVIGVSLLVTNIGGSEAEQTRVCEQSSISTHKELSEGHWTYTSTTTYTGDCVLHGDE